MARREPLTDKRTGKQLARVEQPGYYRGYSTMSQRKYWDAATRDLIEKRLADAKPILFFTEEEARCMQAVVDRVLPQDDRVPERRVPILAGIDDRLFHNRIDGYRYEDMPPDGEAYRVAASAIDATARVLHNHDFADLTTMQQEEILQALHDGEPLAEQEKWSALNLSRFWGMLVGDCATVYYSHPWAWDEIGYGGPAYPRGYMRLEGGMPEPYEKDERRYDWCAPEDTLSDRPQAPAGHGEHVAPPSQGGTH